MLYCADFLDSHLNEPVNSHVILNKDRDPAIRRFIHVVSMPERQRQSTTNSFRAVLKHDRHLLAWGLIAQINYIHYTAHCKQMTLFNTCNDLMHFKSYINTSKTLIECDSLLTVRCTWNNGSFF